MNPSALLVPKDLAQRWGVDLRTVRRRRLMLRMREAGFTGTVPTYTEQEVKRAERAWHAHMRRVQEEHRKRARLPRNRRASGLVTMSQLRAERARHAE